MTTRPVGRGAVDLAAKEAPRPLCPCHDMPMRWRNDRDEWRCAVTQRAHDRAYRQRSTKAKERYDRLKAEGLCCFCGQDVAVTQVRCFDCARKLDEGNSIRL